MRQQQDSGLFLSTQANCLFLALTILETVCLSVCLSSMFGQFVGAIFINVMSLVSLKTLQCLSVPGLFL